MAAKAKALPHFEVDRAGLAKLLQRRGKAFIAAELISNAWDENSTAVDVLLTRLDDDRWKIVIEDDNPNGFIDLSHSFTLFAESLKKDSPDKRGRFNLGEKLVVAVCDTVRITTTTGTVLFTEAGRYLSDQKRKAGSVFEATIKMTDEDAAEMEALVHSLLPPAHIATSFNLHALPVRAPVRTFEASLRTERADADGNLRPTTRKTIVEVFEPLPGEVAMLYELGIPVVETGDRYHVNVGQKVPLNIDRDNVPPGWLRDVRALVLNAVSDLMGADDVKASWVTAAMEDELIEPTALADVIRGRFGEKAVISDPTDTEANKIAAEQGYTVIPGGALPKGAWKAVKTFAIALPAGQVTPSPTPYGDGEPLKIMNPDHYPADVRNVVQFARDLARELLASDIEVRVAQDAQWPFAATYGPRKGGTEGMLTLNVGRLGFKWFRATNRHAIIDLLIHEFGHHVCHDHLDRKYLNALSELGARAVTLALEQPEAYARLTAVKAAV